MAKSTWQPTATDKEIPQSKKEITYSGIKDWIALHGSAEDKEWLIETVEQNTETITFQKVNETKVKAAFCERMGVKAKGTASTKSSPADELRKALKVEKKKK